MHANTRAGLGEFESTYVSPRLRLGFTGTYNFELSQTVSRVCAIFFSLDW